MAVSPFTIVTFNIRGILKDLPTIRHLIAAHNIQAVLIQEINFKGDVDELAIDGYVHYI